MNGRTSRFLSLGVSLGGLVDIGVLLALGGTWLGLIGTWWWVFDLFSHFRLQYLAACLGGIAWFLGRKNKTCVVIATASLLVNAFLVLQVWPREIALADNQSSNLRVVSMNVLTSNRNFDTVLDYLRDTKPDLIFAMEANSRWASVFNSLKKDYPFHWFEPREDNFGVVFMSRIKTIDIHSTEFGSAGVPTVVAVLNHEGRHFVFVGTHPCPPTSRLYSSWRDEQLNEVAAFVKRQSDPVLLVGDLNATPWSSAMRSFIRLSGMNYHSVGFDWAPTWEVSTALAIQVDHSLTTKPLIVAKRQVGRDIGSDHRPLCTEIFWQALDAAKAKPQ